MSGDNYTLQQYIKVASPAVSPSSVSIVTAKVPALQNQVDVVSWGIEHVTPNPKRGPQSPAQDTQNLI